MKTPLVVYDICRYYIRDHAGTLGDLVKVLDGYIRSRNYQALSESMSLFNPAKHGLDQFRALRQIGAFFKKNAAFADGKQCQEAATAAFDRAEKLCRITNRRLSWYYTKRDRLDPDLRLYLDRMERSIHDLLGSFDDFLENLPRNIRVTSGATATLPRQESVPFLKLKKKIDCSPGAVKYLHALQTFWGYRAARFHPLPVNRVAFVPKNWKTHRTIACEPTGNIPLQLAFDRYVKGRLKKIYKIDLGEQFRNQEMARVGSVSGKYCTIDLSMASDTLSRTTVEWLLPTPWLSYLSDIRSAGYVSQAGLFKGYAKFSSMGNGSTFPLETLIFAAAVRAVGSTDYSVYGDDIIVETPLYHEVVRLLKYLGFTVNQEKSYFEGPFRESCGEDWYDGVNVTPFYLRELGNRKTILSHNVNGLASIAKPWGELWAFLREIVKERRLAFVPWNEDTMSGVMIDTPTCYDLHVLRQRKYGPDQNGPTLMFRGYLVLDKTETTEDHRSMFLWHLAKSYSKVVKDETDVWYPVMGAKHFPSLHEAHGHGREPTFAYKYVRKWVHWHPPVAGTPAHAYAWTDFLLAREGQ